jgi:hypothetical protein
MSSNVAGQGRAEPQQTDQGTRGHQNERGATSLHRRKFRSEGEGNLARFAKISEYRGYF